MKGMGWNSYRDDVALEERTAGIFNSVEIRILQAECDDLSPEWWRHESLTNHHWRLYINHGSGGTLVLPDGDFPLVQGEIYLIPTGLEIGTRCSGRFVQFFIHFDLTGIPPLALRELFPGPVLVPHSDLFCMTVAALGQEVIARGTADPAMLCQTKGIVYQAFGLTLSGMPPDALSRSWLRVSTVTPLMPALDCIQQRMSQRITAPDLAALCCMSEDHFIRRFREAVGVAPIQYLRKCRIAAAGQRLLFTDDSIDKIATQTGFLDRFYFSRIFKRETGLSPAAYRRGPRA